MARAAHGGCSLSDLTSKWPAWFVTVAAGRLLVYDVNTNTVEVRG
jgi:hypothetical protein